MSAPVVTAFPDQPSSNSMNVNVQQRVFKVIADILNRKESEIRLDASIRSDLQASSLDQMTLYVALEDEFQRTMPPEEVTELITVKDIVSFIDRKLQETTSA
ncbi:acyl carrier protein [Sulfuricaulis sp.]|uniref:acyl carrier protein n=1 Tax=Sulfuricaulis sp. TaxID=2003553 RepID=UPI003C7602E5